MSSPPAHHSGPNSSLHPGCEDKAGADDVEQKAGPTLRPPPLEKPAGEPPDPLAVVRATATKPVDRRTGPRAYQAALETRLARASAELDSERERQVSVALARWLAARSMELHRATWLGRRALVLGEDSSLRAELSSWFCMLGDHAAAAVTLLPLADEQPAVEAARTLVSASRLLSRAGRADEAKVWLERAAELDPKSPVALELLGGLGSAAPDQVSPQVAATSYLRAASIRDSERNRTLAFEDRLRAFERDPSQLEAAEGLAAALVWRGRAGAADEVLREHARASGPGEEQVHRRRMREALQRGDVVLALIAALDAWSDAHLDPAELVDALRGAVGGGPPTTVLTFDELLERVQWLELLAARLEVALWVGEGDDVGSCRAALARLCAGPLKRPQRAAELWIESLAATPSDAEAWEEVDAAAQGNPWLLLDAFGWVACSSSPAAAARTHKLAERILGEAERLEDSALAVWAARALLGADPTHALAREARERHAAAAEKARVALDAGIEAALESGDSRALERCARRLRSHPDRAEDAIRVLSALVGQTEDARWLAALHRMLRRLGRRADVSQLFQRQLARGAGSAEQALRLSLARNRLEMGDWGPALDALRPALWRDTVAPEAAALAAVLAARLREDSARAAALGHLANGLAPPLRAGVKAVVAEGHLAAGDSHAAWAAAQSAFQTDASLARAVAVRAAAAVARADSESAAALERAAEFVVPRASVCAALARLHSERKDTALAVAWSRRWLNLCPGDTDALEAFLSSAVRLQEPDAVAEALELILSGPGPSAVLVGPVAALLGRLTELAPKRATAFAWRALGEFGPGAAALRQAVQAAAELADHPGLTLALSERWVASGAEPVAGTLLDIARRRRASADADGMANALLRALDAGADPAAVLEVLSGAPASRSSDGELWTVEVRARALLLSEKPVEAALAWRELGAVRWDLGLDRHGAVQAWRQAAKLDPDLGIEYFACDLVAFGGHDQALDQLDQWADRCDDPKELAHVLGVQALVALQGGQRSRALQAAARALELDPMRADILAVAERSAREPEGIAMLEVIYDGLARQSAGRYGERTVHYRAARHFERCSLFEHAIEHACLSFQAVPTEGAALALLLRLAEQAVDVAHAVEVLSRSARKVGDPERRRRWLTHAASLAARLPDGGRRRFELITEVVGPPDEASLERVMAALVELKAHAEPDEIVDLFKTVVLGFIRAIEGPIAAELAVGAAVMALDRLDEPSAAFAAVALACTQDCSPNALARLTEQEPQLLRDPSAAKQFLREAVPAVCDAPSRPSDAVINWMVGLAAKLGEHAAVAALLAVAATGQSNQAKVAALFAQASNEALALVCAQEPIARHRGALTQLVLEAMRREHLPVAATVLEHLVELIAPPSRGYEQAIDNLREVYARLGRRESLETLVSRELGREGLDVERRAKLALELAALVGVRGDPKRALLILRDSFGEEAAPEAVYEDALVLARQAGDHDAEKWALQHLAECVALPERRLEVLRELAQTLDANGEPAAALTYWSAVLELAPHDPAVIGRLRQQSEAPRSGRSDPPPAVETKGASPRSPMSPAAAFEQRGESTNDSRIRDPATLGTPVEARGDVSPDGTAGVAPGDATPTVDRVAPRSSQTAEPPVAQTPQRAQAGRIAAVTDREATLLRSLNEGDVEAGKQFVEELWQRPDRTGDLVAVCQRLVALLPCDPWPLKRLVHAAQADHNPAYANAVQHVLASLGLSEQEIEPPPLHHQAEQPELVHALLFRDGVPANEALSIVWEGAERLLRHDLSEYGITGLERVTLNAPTLLGQSYTDAARALGLTRIPLFLRRSPEPFSLRVALLSPPSVIAAGEITEDRSALGFALGSALAAAMPGHALLFGMPESRARELLNGLMLAFGPPERAPQRTAGAVSFAEMLWQAIGARDQRRLRELCDDPEGVRYEAALRAARRAARRAGLFVAGDLGASLRRLAGGEQEGALAPESEDLVRICTATAGGRDLFRLATSAEYAQTRWQRRPSSAPASENRGSVRSQG